VTAVRTRPRASGTGPDPDRRRRRRRIRIIALLATALHSGPAYAAENDAVRVWNERAVTTLTAGPTAPTPGVQFAPPVAFIHLAIVQGAVYDGVNAIKGGSIPKEYIKPVEAGIVEAMEGGILAGYPLVNVKVELYDGTYHEVDSSEVAFKVAGSMALRSAAAGITSLRPISSPMAR